jgi:DNA-directed RNA polymerase specialized sigma24 family protein/AraC-like DNA-binding protein
VTVQGEDSPVADAEFEAIFRQYFGQLSRFIRVRVQDAHRHLAEDLAQEAFIDLWNSFVKPGRLHEVERVYPLLATIARMTISSFYKTKSNILGAATDFSDPVNTPLIVTGHVYVHESPDLALLGRELNDAMAAMTAASKTWRDKDQTRGQLRRYLNDGNRYFLGGLTPETKARMQNDLADAEHAEAHALLAFRDACQAVAELRGELERAAGPNWSSSTGMPSSLGTRRREDGSYTSDPTVTHCPQGHLMDRDNTYFYDDGTRSCRYCAAARGEKNNQRRRAANPATREATQTTSPEVIEAARKMLTDPTQQLSLAKIADAVGVSTATLAKRLPAEVAARKSLRVIDPNVLDGARRMLADPAHDTKTLQQIADVSGCSYQTVSRRLRAEVAARKARQDAPLRAARAMLADPAYLKLSVVRIAQQTGTSDTALYARLPVSELRRSAKAKAKETAGR